MLLNELKNQWNAVLDDLEASDRIAWIAFFDGRLVSLENDLLTLDFSDAEKFSDGHDYRDVRIRKQGALQSSIEKVTGVRITLA